MDNKICSYHVISNGEASTLTTSCSYENRGGFSKITFSNGASFYSFLIGKSAVTISTKGDMSYSFTLKEKVKDSFSIKAHNATFSAQVSCKNLKIEQNNQNLKVTASYVMDLSGNFTTIDFLLTVK